jgi:four helix bundle protein
VGDQFESGFSEARLYNAFKTGSNKMASTSFENLRVYQLSEKLADAVWNIVLKWDWFAKDTVGKQFVKAADSVGANISEGSGRGSYQDNRRFVKISRGSLNEVKHWKRRACNRRLLTDEEVKQLDSIIEELAPRLNAYLNSIGCGPEEPTYNLNDN